MQALKVLLKAANFCVSLVVILTMCAAGAFSVYALWDNSQVYRAAGDVQASMLHLKPQADPTAAEGPTFDELLAVNPDVCAWLTLDGTNIDYPVLQGESNLSYINTDVYGNFARGQYFSGFPQQQQLCGCVQPAVRPPYGEQPDVW